MKYEITIKAIEENEVEVRDYQVIGEDKNGEKEWGFINIPQIKEVETEIYRQTSSDGIDLKKIIDAFNS